MKDYDNAAKSGIKATEVGEPRAAGMVCTLGRFARGIGPGFAPRGRRLAWCASSVCRQQRSTISTGRPRQVGMDNGGSWTDYKTQGKAFGRVAKAYEGAGNVRCAPIQ